MGTDTKPIGWKQESNILLAVPPAHLSRKWGLKYIVTKKERLKLVNAHIFGLPKLKKDAAVDGIEAAVRKFLFADNFDDRPLPAHIRERMKKLDKAASTLLRQLEDCDDLTWEVITKKADVTQRLPPEPLERKGKSELSNALYTPIEIEPMDPPDRLIDQLGQYATMFSKLAKSAGAMSNRRSKTALSDLIGELKLVWKNAKGTDGKGDPLFTDFVEAVANLQVVRDIIPPAGLQRLKLQRIINKT
jgi:hypothetical protein